MGILELFFFLISPLWANYSCSKNIVINNFESMKFQKVPYKEIYQSNFNKYNSLKFSVIKQNGFYKVKFSVKCKKNKYRIKFQVPSVYDVEIKRLTLQKLSGNNQFNEGLLTKNISNFLLHQGYLSNKVSLKMSNGKNITVITSLGKLQKLSSIEIVGNVPSQITRFINEKFKFTILSQQNILKIINQTNKKIRSLKYKFFDVSYSVKKRGNKNILIISISNLFKVYINTITERKHINTYELNNFLYSRIRTKLDLNKVLISKNVKKYFMQRGWFSVVSKVRIVRQYTERFDHQYIFLHISKGEKKRLLSLKFKNAEGLSSNLEKMYSEKASAKASAGYWDSDFMYKFKSEVENYLYARGYVYSKVVGPIVIVENNNIKVSFNITLNSKVIVRSIKIMDDEILPIPKKLILVNRTNSFLNITKVKKDLIKTLNYYKKHGYIYAQTYSFSKKIINYVDNHAELLFPIHLGKIAKLAKIRIVGNISTKKYVIQREIKLVKGDILTTVKISELRNSMLALGLFQSVKIKLKPLKNYIGRYQFSDLEIELIEKKFGVAEIKPGFRSDLGFRLATKLSYNNFLHKHHQISLQIEGNKRISDSGLDPTRIKPENSFIEHDFRLIYKIPYFISNMDLTSSMSRKKKMFFAYDAQITKLSELINKRLTKKVEIYSVFQFENIDQFNGSTENVNDTFKIGSLSVGLIFDNRNRNVFTNDGYWGNYSWEINHPALGSLNNNSGEINFYKIQVQNRFYKSFKRNILALSINLGFEKNLSRALVTNTNGNQQTKGYIPSIKVFRLSGIDAVRGYSEDEINRINNKDISETRIDNQVSFISGKFEYRIPLSENLYCAPFYDFGNLFINSKINIETLRQSIGFVAKFLTPVGTIDLSYGVKLKRINNLSINESFGQLDLKIGFF